MRPPPLTKAYSSYNLKKDLLSYSHSLSPHSTATVPDEIIPRLYLTDLSTTTKLLLPSWSSNHSTFPRIKYILTVLASSIDQPHAKPANRAADYVQKLIILDDDLNADLLIQLDDAVDWISESLSANDGGVLVHCHLGQSRSASMIIAYMMRERNLTYQAALERVKRKRAMVRPNTNFARQLELWHDMDCSVTDDDDGQLKNLYILFKEDMKRRKLALANAI